MNCHRARQLISPYLDHQLTGQQMLALQQHFSECGSCDSEMRSLRDVKRLLRSLHETRPHTDLPESITRRLEEAQTSAMVWPLMPALFPDLTRPQRGRRLMTALALSCLTLFAVAAPFAPASQDGVLASGVFLLPAQRFPMPVNVSYATAWSQPTDVTVRPAELLILTDSDEARRERLFAAPIELPLQKDQAAAPLSDDIVPGYVQGDAAYAGYRSR